MVSQSKLKYYEQNAIKEDGIFFFCEYFILMKYLLMDFSDNI